MPTPETDATAQSDAKLVAALNASIKLNASIESEGIDLAIDQVPDAWWSGNPGVLHGMQMTFRGKKATGRPLALLLWLHLASDDCLAIVAWRGGAHLVFAPSVYPLQREEKAVGVRSSSPAAREAIAYAEATIDRLLESTITSLASRTGQNGDSA